MGNMDSENRKNENQSHLDIERTQMADLIFTMTLFCIFAICAVFVVIMGAKLYQNTTESMNRNFTARTAVAYVSEKMRQRDIEGSVRVMNIDDICVLSLVKQYDAASVYSYVYARDGYLQELTLTGLMEPDLSMGSKILQIQDMKVEELTKGLVKVVITDLSGKRDAFFLAAKCDDGMDGMTMTAPDSMPLPGDGDISMAPPEESQENDFEIQGETLEEFSEPVRIESEQAEEETE